MTQANAQPDKAAQTGRSPMEAQPTAGDVERHWLDPIEIATRWKSAPWGSMCERDINILIEAVLRTAPAVDALTTAKEWLSLYTTSCGLNVGPADLATLLTRERDEAQRRLDEAVKAEREACAVIGDAEYQNQTVPVHRGAYRVAAAIRARKESQP